MGGVERRISASHTRLLVERFRELPAEARADLEQRAAVEIAAVAQLSPAGWTPLQLQLNLVHALRQTMPERDFEDFWREQFLLTCRLDSMAPAIAGAMRLFGASPDMLIKASGRMWRLVSRGCGELRPELYDEGRMVVHMTNLPTEDFDFVDDWVVAWGGVLRGGLDLIGRDSQVQLSLWEPGLGLAVFEIEFEVEVDSGRESSAVPQAVSLRDSEALAYQT